MRLIVMVLAEIELIFLVGAFMMLFWIFDGNSFDNTPMVLVVA